MKHCLSEIQNIAREGNEIRMILDIIEKAQNDYSLILSIGNLESLRNDDLRIRRVISAAKHCLRDIDVFKRLNDSVRGVENVQVHSIVIKFKRALIPVKIEIERFGYVRERFELKGLDTLLNEIKQSRKDFSDKRIHLVLDTMKEFIDEVKEDLEQLKLDIKSTDIGEILDAEEEYLNVPEYVSIIDALFSELDMVELLDIESDLYRIWENGCDREFYILTKAAMRELYQRDES